VAAAAAAAPAATAAAAAFIPQWHVKISCYYDRRYHIFQIFSTLLKCPGLNPARWESVKVITLMWVALISVLSESHSIQRMTQLWHVDMPNIEVASVLFAWFCTVVPSYSGLSSPRRWSPSKCQEVLIQWHQHVPKVWKLRHDWFENIKLAWLVVSPRILLLHGREN
jgi:hypothetical protein